MINQRRALEPPKLGCLPCRTTLIFLSVLGIIAFPSSCLTQTGMSQPGSHITGALFGLFANCVILYGALKYHDLSLAIGLWIYYFFLFFYVIALLTIPVVLASFMSSGFFNQLSIPVESFPLETDQETVPPTTEYSRNLFMGITVGLFVEACIAIGVAINYGIVVMIRRLRKYSTAWREEKAYGELPQYSVT